MYFLLHKDDDGTIQANTFTSKTGLTEYLNDNEEYEFDSQDFEWLSDADIGDLCNLGCNSAVLMKDGRVVIPEVCKRATTWKID